MTLKQIRSIHAASPFDAVRFTIAIRDYLADTIRRRRDQSLTWTRQTEYGDEVLAEMTTVQGQRRRLELFQWPKKSALVVFVPVDVETFGRIDPIDELAQVRAQLTEVQTTAMATGARVHELTAALVESQRIANKLAASLKEQDLREQEMRTDIADLKVNVSELEFMVQRTRREIRTFSEDLEDARLINSSLYEDIEALKRKNGAMGAIAETLSKQRDEALAQRDAAKAELAAMHEIRARAEEIDRINRYRVDDDKRPIEMYDTPQKTPVTSHDNDYHF